MKEARFREYIARFNAADDTAFDDYLAQDLHVKNGTLEFTGIDGMKRHYRELIWPDFREELTVPRYVSESDRAAVQMTTLFTALHNRQDSLFGAVNKGETFEFNGVIMYEINAQDRFSDILVAYNSFVHTDLDGVRHDLGIPH